MALEDSRSSAIELHVILDLLNAHRIQGADQGLDLLACPVVHSVHPDEGHSGEADARKIPVVPLDAVLVHHIVAPGEAALRELGQLHPHHG
eukprot:CAMPEP_0113827092 /NCGR_PEP_ID=MMETSP0328-20130328/4593_1 /TAXON_ID=39455 /ORGANISM="Alexandrium minutum" /LENGTH=90 /DNA_ID=CAMNT_0000795079 /DNA_START=172 /DNA_END=442 /DNA_ORIENTATION=+ /assembly_acc=CAM_ASM_000350